MKIKIKAFFFALPLVILLQMILLIFGVMMFGNKFNLDSLKFIGSISLIVVYFQVLKRLTQIEKDKGLNI